MLYDDFNTTIEYLDFRDSKKALEAANNIIKKSYALNVFRQDDFTEPRMVLANVITFKGLWQFPFNKSETTLEPFYDENKTQIGRVNMMYQRATIPISNIRAMNALAIEMGYGDEEIYSMFLLLPYPKLKVADVYKNLGNVSIADIYRRFQSDIIDFDVTEVDVRIPRFRISTNVILNRALERMGVYDIFRPDLACFDRITKDKIIFSPIVVHAADVEVTESGIENDAVTTSMISYKLDIPVFHANRPFIYFIMEKPTTTLIFGGVYSEPTRF